MEAVAVKAPMISSAGDGEVFAMEPGSLVRFKVLSRDTGGVFEMYERVVPPHTIGADPHLHRTQTETFYVVQGRPTILVGSSALQYDPGSVVVVTPNTTHGFANATDAAVTMLVCFTPGLNHENYFREMSALKAGPPELYQAGLNELRTRFDAWTVPLDPDLRWDFRADRATPGKRRPG